MLKNKSKYLIVEFWKANNHLKNFYAGVFSQHYSPILLAQLFEDFKQILEAGIHVVGNAV
ncbi:hypothetical protein [Coxiella-like endosymbiont]|uniref:hypothetical protein n=1 Tax=Coxiella-like endosymbiont TaxID=1592897 RepID=UPI00272A016E|nr:hypothetical protein [Coxiella-like endosymbiont]